MTPESAINLLERLTDVIAVPESVADLLGLTLLVVLIIVLLRVIESALRVRIGPDRDLEQLQKQIDQLKGQLQRERIEATGRITVLEGQLAFLTEQLQNTVKTMGVLERKAQVLEAENARLLAELDQHATKLPDVPLLHICGDPLFCQDDRIQINRARVPYRAMDRATRDAVEGEMQRRREDGTEYLWILVSAHGTREGIALEDGLAPPHWWSRAIDAKTKLLVLANCDGPEVGDALAGIVERVIVMYGDIATDDAAAFVLSLFRSLWTGAAIDDAYWFARQQVPQIAPFIDIRKA